MVNISSFVHMIPFGIIAIITGVSISGIRSRLLVRMPNGTTISWQIEPSELNSDPMNKNLITHTSNDSKTKPPALGSK
jgi:hypothetical protein